MTERVHQNPALIYSVGTQIVVLRDVVASNGRTLHPSGSVGVVIRAPVDLEHAYRIRFPDGHEGALRSNELVMLAQYQEGQLAPSTAELGRGELYDRVIYRCVIGSRAYGLDDERSDIDYRGVYLPRAETHWSLYGVPEQIECQATQEHYWELQRFLVLALKANPNVLECLYTPLIEHCTSLGHELLEMRSAFLSRLVYQTFNGYVLSQFKKMQADRRNQGQVKWKHVMHLLRLLLTGIGTLRTGAVPVRVDEHRDQLLTVKRGEMPWEQTEQWRLSLHQEFERALEQTHLPERPDYERANALLIRARRAALSEELP
ncbi:MAG TPA: nucleotidyltransferase domain-containing protein [Planctomycetaceae bacterium]|nr:nucleotidyltransferase domain-containing protein [Planctomycetaceae bacterium]